MGEATFVRLETLGAGFAGGRRSHRPAGKIMRDIKVSRGQLGRWIMLLLRKALTLAALGVIFGMLYDWAGPWAYPKNQQVGFRYGVLHGAMMPISLPTLLLGKDVTIYANNNDGRSYKIGYICGINLCGLIFFGAAFWRPKPKSAP
jgi:hypothetical protein